MSLRTKLAGMATAAIAVISLLPMEQAAASPGACVARPTTATPTGSFVYDNLPKQPRTNANRATDTGLQTAGNSLILGRTGPSSVTWQLWRHYLSGSGTPETINLYSLLTAQPPLLASYDHYLRVGAQNAVNQLKATTPPTSCAVASISSGWIGYTITNQSDWYFALRNFGYQLAGSVWIGPADAKGNRPLSIVYQALLADTYNFNTTDSQFGRFEQLARDGWAADFRVSGLYGQFTITSSTASFNASGLGIPM